MIFLSYNAGRFNHDMQHLKLLVFNGVIAQSCAARSSIYYNLLQNENTHGKF